MTEKMIKKKERKERGSSMNFNFLPSQKIIWWWYQILKSEFVTDLWYIKPYRDLGMDWGYRFDGLVKMKLNICSTLFWGLIWIWLSHLHWCNVIMLLDSFCCTRPCLCRPFLFQLGPKSWGFPSIWADINCFFTIVAFEYYLLLRQFYCVLFL